jgi:hypothetical protein
MIGRPLTGFAETCAFFVFFCRDLTGFPLGMTDRGFRDSKQKYGDCVGVVSAL